jgi:hypothetical protein
MSNKIKFTFVAAVMAMGIVSPALAQTVQHNYAAAHRSRIYNSDTPYNYIPPQGEQSSWPSAAAMGNSH